MLAHCSHQYLDSLAYSTLWHSSKKRMRSTSQSWILALPTTFFLSQLIYDPTFSCMSFLRKATCEFSKFSLRNLVGNFKYNKSVTFPNCHFQQMIAWASSYLLFYVIYRLPAFCFGLKWNKHWQTGWLYDHEILYNLQLEMTWGLNYLFSAV